MAKKQVKGQFIGSAEDRWQLSRRFIPEAVSVPNEHLIQDMIVQMGMTRGEITERLLLYPANLDCIIDDAHRRAMSAWHKTPEPTEAQRVLYIKDQISRGKADDRWTNLLKGNKLVDRNAYHKLRHQRLDEQVGRSLTQEKYRRDKASANDVQTGSMKLGAVKDINIPRAPTGLTGFDLLGGQDDEDFEQIGFCEGDVWLVGGAPGVGKTKVMMTAMAVACGPIMGETGLYVQSEFDIETFKRRYARGIVAGDEELYISCSTTMGAIIEEIYRRKPRWVVVDSKDKIEECKTTAGWARFQHRMRLIAKDLCCTIFLITHLNADDKIFGGRKIEHDVDGIMLVTRVPECRGAFKIGVPEKNRGGMACPEHHSLWVHHGSKILCTAQAPRWKSKTSDIVGPGPNPILEKPPTSTVDEEMLQHELNDLLDKITDKGMDSLTEGDKERLHHLSEWMAKRDSKEVQSKKKELAAAAKLAEKAAKEAQKQKDAAEFLGAGDEDKDEEGAD